MRKTYAMVQVAFALLDESDAKHWGYETSKKTGIRPGVLYPIFGRMLAEGLLVDGWEDPATITAKRPPRRYYELTDKGKVELGAVLAEARRDTRFARLLNLGWT